jgi:hypothetical protein
MTSGRKGEAMWRYTTIGVIIAGLCSLTGCGNTVSPGQRGLRWYPLTEGLTTETLKSGFYWRAPWNDVYVYDVRLQSYAEMVDALSSDDLLVKLKAAIIMRPIAEEVYFLAQEIGPDFYPRVVRPELLAAVRSVVSNYPMVAVPEMSAEIASKVQAVVVEKLKGRRSFWKRWNVSKPRSRKRNKRNSSSSLRRRKRRSPDGGRAVRATRYEFDRKARPKG